MGQNTRGIKELSREQKLKKENRKLRRENDSLRKQLAKVDLDKFSFVREKIQKIERSNQILDSKRMLDDLKKTWQCHNCAEGHLEINVYSKMGDLWYFRQCVCCEKRTPSKVYIKEKVQGILRNSTVE